MVDICDKDSLQCATPACTTSCSARIQSKTLHCCKLWLTIDYWGCLCSLASGPSGPYNTATLDGGWYAFQTADRHVKSEFLWGFVLVLAVNLTLQLGKHSAPALLLWVALYYV